MKIWHFSTKFAKKNEKCIPFSSSFFECSLGPFRDKIIMANSNLDSILMTNFGPRFCAGFAKFSQNFGKKLHTKIRFLSLSGRSVFQAPNRTRFTSPTLNIRYENELSLSKIWYPKGPRFMRLIGGLRFLGVNRPMNPHNSKPHNKNLSTQIHENLKPAVNRQPGFHRRDL